MRKYFTLLLAGSFVTVAAMAQSTSILGFSTTAAGAQLSEEKIFDGNLSAKNIDVLIKDVQFISSDVVLFGEPFNDV